MSRPAVPPLWSGNKPAFMEMGAADGRRGISSTSRPAIGRAGAVPPLRLGQGRNQGQGQLQPNRFPVQVETARPAHRRDESGRLVLPSVPGIRPLSRQLNYRIDTPDGVHRKKVDLGIPATPRSTISAFSAQQNDYMVSLSQLLNTSKSQTARSGTQRRVDRADVGGSRSPPRTQRDSQVHRKQFEASMAQLQSLIDSVSSDRRRKAMLDEMNELKQLAMEAEAAPNVGQSGEWTMEQEDTRSSVQPGLFGVGSEIVINDDDPDARRTERRSNRRIQEDVGMRLEMLLGDQQTQTDFQKYLAKIKPNEQVKGTGGKATPGYAIMAENMKIPRQYTPEATKARIARMKRQREEKRLQVLERAELAAQERAQRTLASAHRREIRLRQAADTAAKQASLAQQQQLQKRWAVLVAVGARQRMFCEAIERQRAMRAVTALQTPAARAIQTWYRRIFYRRVEGEQIRARVIVLRALRKMMRRWKAWNMLRSANMIRDFFYEVKEVTKIVKVVKKYRLCVITLQRFVRARGPVTHMQLLRLREHWLALEGPMLEEKNRKLRKRHDKEVMRQKALRNKLVSTAVARREKERKDKGFKMRDLGDAFATVIPPVTDEIRMPILVKDLKRRKLLFLEEMVAHKAAIERWKQHREIDVARAILDHATEENAASKEEAQAQEAEAAEAQAQAQTQTQGAHTHATDGLLSRSASASDTASGSGSGSAGGGLMGIVAAAEERERETREKEREREREREEAAAAPRKPIFDWRLTDDYMRRLVEQGIRDLIDGMEEKIADV